jgi:hypothetical protein
MSELRAVASRTAIELSEAKVGHMHRNSPGSGGAPRPLQVFPSGHAEVVSRAASHRVAHRHEMFDGQWHERHSVRQTQTGAWNFKTATNKTLVLPTSAVPCTSASPSE